MSEPFKPLTPKQKLRLYLEEAIRMLDEPDLQCRYNALKGLQAVETHFLNGQTLEGMEEELNAIVADMEASLRQQEDFISDFPNRMRNLPSE